MRFWTRWLIAPTLAALALVPVSSCTQTECGDGTVEVDGKCEPLLPANCAGDGVRFENGRCVANLDDVCGPGTVENDAGQCVSDGSVIDPAPDAGRDPVDEQDMGDDVAADLRGDVGVDLAVDVLDEEVIEFVPVCDDELDPGVTICMWGQSRDFITGGPLPGNSDPPLEVQVKDLLEALDDETAVVDETLIQPGGYFLLPSVELTAPPQNLLLIVGEREDGETLEGPGETWQRSISGLVRTSAAVEEHSELVVFSLRRSAVQGWNAELGLQPPLPTLETKGFLLARILDATTRLPIPGATLGYEGSSEITIRYFSDAEMTEFGGDSTGPSGTAMLTGSAATDTCNATADGYAQTSSVNCGTSDGRASIVHIFLLEL